jgi:RNA 2',3'-cyclic 3'-phosphodiesterase
VRIFIGIKLEEDIRAQIEKELKPFKKMKTPIRWTEPENIHLTLKFVGEVSADIYPEMERAVASGHFELKPFRINFRGLGKFPAGDEVHIFWAGIEPVVELETLFRRIEDILIRFGVEKETRRFLPHITVGRNRARFPFKSLLNELEKKCDVRLGESIASSFQIFESRLTPRGPIYTVRQEVAIA